MRLRLYEVGVDNTWLGFTPSRNIDLNCLRVHLYKQGSPGGAIRISVTQAESLSFTLATHTVNVSEISSASYFHGFVKFNVAMNLKSGTPYFVYMSSTGAYSADASNYVAWAVSSGLPNCIEFWENKNLVRGNL